MSPMPMPAPIAARPMPMPAPAPVNLAVPAACRSTACFCTSVSNLLDGIGVPDWANASPPNVRNSTAARATRDMSLMGGQTPVFGSVGSVFRVQRHADERRRQEDKHERLQQSHEQLQQAQGDQGDHADYGDRPEQVAGQQILL